MKKLIILCILLLTITIVPSSFTSYNTIITPQSDEFVSYIENIDIVYTPEKISDSTSHHIADACFGEVNRLTTKNDANQKILSIKYSDMILTKLVSDYLLNYKIPIRLFALDPSKRVLGREDHIDFFT